MGTGLCVLGMNRARRILAAVQEVREKDELVKQLLQEYEAMPKNIQR